MREKYQSTHLQPRCTVKTAYKPELKIVILHFFHIPWHVWNGAVSRQASQIHNRSVYDFSILNVAREIKDSPIILSVFSSMCECLIAL